MWPVPYHLKKGQCIDMGGHYDFSKSSQGYANSCRRTFG